jgi:adenylate kinase
MNNSEKINTIKKWLESGSIIIFGRPFAGKDYQSNKLAEFFDGNAASSGNILRNSVLPESTEQAMIAGQLVPTEDFVNIVLPYLSQPTLANKPLFLSSFGRWHGEEEGVIVACNTAGHPIRAVLYLEMSDDDIYKRWQSEDHSERHNRQDDSIEVLQKRLVEFADKTAPVLDYYTDLGLLIGIDGRPARDEVTNLIIDALYERARRELGIY